MKTRFLILFSLSIFLINSTQAQNPDMENLPYAEIPSYPENYAPGNVMSRFIDGLGYRYYWASEGLTQKDLAYQPTEDSRSTMETIEHIYDLSVTILNFSLGKINERPDSIPFMTYEGFRAQTLINFQLASKALANKSEAELAEMKIRNSSASGIREFPLWNGMNGQISDAIYHTGQLVSYRRTSGNPMNPNVSVFMGKNRD